MHKSGIGEKMKYFHFTSISLLLIVSAAFSEDSGIYLCIDSMKQQFSETGKPPQKLVYGYIDGKKTECMSEYELRAELSRISFQQSSASVPDSQQLLEMNGLKRKLPSGSGNLYKSICNGRKDLSGVDLRGYDLKSVDLSGANLSNANLESADLRSAILDGADLTGANLKYAYLKHTKLKSAKLTNASLKGAYFQGADLSGVSGLNLDNLRETASLYNSVLDSVLMDGVKEYFPAKLKDPGFQWQATYYSEQQETPEDQRVNRKNCR